MSWLMVGYHHWVGAIVFLVIEDNLWIREQKKFSIRFTILILDTEIHKNERDILLSYKNSIREYKK